MFDLDNIQDPRGYYEARVAPRVAELGVVLAHVTPSQEGLRLIFILPGARRWMAGRLGAAASDTSVSDYARCSFVVPADYILYINEEELFGGREAEFPPEEAAEEAPAAPGCAGSPTTQRNDNKKSESDGIRVR